MPVVNAFAGGNPNLQPETAYEWTYGAVITPGKWWSPLQGLTLSADFYHIDIRAVTTQPNPQFFVDHEDQFPGQVIRGPPLTARAIRPDCPCPGPAREPWPIYTRRLGLRGGLFPRHLTIGSW